MRNIRLAFRTLFRTPFVTAVAIISLALGIGANAAIFSLFNQFLLRPLPVATPQELVNLGNPGPKPGSQSCNNAGAAGEPSTAFHTRAVASSPAVRKCFPSGLNSTCVTAAVCRTEKTS